jgi:predicted SnoaL-like aldol condensation-catalyzing enzyme
MTDNHAFIDREGTIHQPKPVMVESWKQFFTDVPDYRNTFTRIQSEGDLVVILGYAYWSEKQAYDPVIWTAAIENDLVREWRVYADTPEVRRRFKLV